MSPYDFLSSHHYTYSYHVTSSFDQQFLSFWGQRTDRQTDRQTEAKHYQLHTAQLASR